MHNVFGFDGGAGPADPTASHQRGPRQQSEPTMTANDKCQFRECKPVQRTVCVISTMTLWDINWIQSCMATPRVLVSGDFSGTYNEGTSWTVQNCFISFLLLSSLPSLTSKSCSRICSHGKVQLRVRASTVVLRSYWRWANRHGHVTQTE